MDNFFVTKAAEGNTYCSIKENEFIHGNNDGDFEELIEEDVMSC